MGWVVNTKLSISALIFLFLCFVGTGSAKPANEASVLKTTGISKWVPNEIVVKFNKGCSKARIKHINQRHSTSVLYSSSNGGFKRIKVPAGKRAEEMVEFYSREADVEYAELN